VQSNPTSPTAGGRRGSLALAGLGLVLGIAGVVGYFVLVIHFGAWLPGARNHALPSWLLIAVGLALSVLAVVRARRGRRLVSSLLLVLNFAAAGAFANLIYVKFVVPEARGPAVGSRAADFALADQTGKVVRLGDFTGKPLLLVFYRGHW
jgi:hypothetical protein